MSNKGLLTIGVILVVFGLFGSSLHLFSIAGTNTQCQYVTASSYKVQFSQSFDTGPVGGGQNCRYFVTPDQIVAVQNVPQGATLDPSSYVTVTGGGHTGKTSIVQYSDTCSMANTTLFGIQDGQQLYSLVTGFDFAGGCTVSVTNYHFVFNVPTQTTQSPVQTQNNTQPTNGSTSSCSSTIPTCSNGFSTSYINGCAVFTCIMLANTSSQTQSSIPVPSNSSSQAIILVGGLFIIGGIVKKD